MSRLRCPRRNRPAPPAAVLEQSEGGHGRRADNEEPFGAQQRMIAAIEPLVPEWRERPNSGRSRRLAYGPKATIGEGGSESLLSDRNETTVFLA